MPIWASTVGRWWGSNPDLKRQEEIDLVAADGRSAIFGECKWKNELMGSGVLDDLQRRAMILRQYEERHYMLFSKSGFTADLRSKAVKAGNVELVELGDLFFDLELGTES